MIGVLILAVVCYVIAETHVDSRNVRLRHEREAALQREREERARLRSPEPRP
jgi:hypothetical protein